MRLFSEISITESRLRVGLGTFVAVEATGPDRGTVMRGIEAAYSAVVRVEALMHPTRPGSDLDAIHRAPIGARVAVDAWTWEVLCLAKRLNHASQGIFDPCLPDAPGRLADLELLTEGGVVAHSSVALDLGGIAKGFAVDRALLALIEGHCIGGMINAGGDLAVFGHRGHDVLCTDSAGESAVIVLKNAALATSDAQNPERPSEHRGYYHGIDRSPITSGRITVCAPNGALADGLTKCLLACSGATRTSLLRTFGGRIVAD